MPPPARKKGKPSIWFSQPLIVYVIIGIAIGLAAVTFARHNKPTQSVIPPPKRQSEEVITQSVISPPAAKPETKTEQQKTTDQTTAPSTPQTDREKANGFIAKIEADKADTKSKDQLKAIYLDKLVKTEASFWIFKDVGLLKSFPEHYFRAHAAQILFNYNRDIDEAVNLIENVVSDPTVNANSYNVAMDYITQYFLQKGSFEDSIYWLKRAIGGRKDDVVLARWYGFLIQQQLQIQDFTNANRSALRCLKDLENSPTSFPFACWHEKGMIELFDARLEQARNTFTHFYTEAIKRWGNEAGQLCASASFVPLSLDSLSHADRVQTGKVFNDNACSMFSKYSSSCSQQQYPFYVSYDKQNSAIITRHEYTNNSVFTNMRCFTPKEKSVVVYKFQEVTVQGKPKFIMESGVSGANCHLYTPSYPYVNSLCYPRYSGMTTYQYPNLPIIRIERALVLHFLDNNYYHLTVEAFAQLLVFSKLPEVEKGSYKILMSSSKMGDYYLKLLGLSDYHVAYDETKYRYHIKEVFAVDWEFTDAENSIVHSNEEYYIPPDTLLKAVQDTILSKMEVQTKLSKKIVFFHRDSNSRAMENHNEVYTFLERVAKSNGYTFTTHSGSDSFNSQLQMMSSASIIVGYHGAGLTNMLFTAPGAAVVELPVYPEKVSVYSRMANALNHPYYVVPSFSSYHFASTRNVVSEQMLLDLSATIKYIIDDQNANLFNK